MHVLVLKYVSVMLINSKDIECIEKETGTT